MPQTRRATLHPASESCLRCIKPLFCVAPPFGPGAQLRRRKHSSMLRADSGPAKARRRCCTGRGCGSWRGRPRPSLACRGASARRARLLLAVVCSARRRRQSVRAPAPFPLCLCARAPSCGTRVPFCTVQGHVGGRRQQRSKESLIQWLRNSAGRQLLMYVCCVYTFILTTRVPSKSYVRSELELRCSLAVSM